MIRYFSAFALVICLGSCGSSSAKSGSSSVASSSTGATSSAARCGPRSAHTLAASRVARVYVLNGTVYGCSQKTHKRLRLGASPSRFAMQRIGLVTVTGDLAAYASQSSGIDFGTTEVIVRRLSDGKQLSNNRAATLPLVESFQSVDSIVLRADGDVAWIAAESSVVAHRTDIEVHEADSAGEKLLERGAGIDPRSLQLHGSKLTWKQSAITRSATLD